MVRGISLTTKDTSSLMPSHVRAKCLGDGMVIDYDVTNAELDVLHLLWQHGPMTVRQLADILYPGGKAAQYATVQTLLGRLESKECVRGDRALRPHQFRAAVGRE